MKYQVYDVSGLTRKQLIKFAEVFLKCYYNPEDMVWYILYRVESCSIPYHFLKSVHSTKETAYNRIKRNYITEPFVPIDAERMLI